MFFSNDNNLNQNSAFKYHSYETFADSEFWNYYIVFHRSLSYNLIIVRMISLPKWREDAIGVHSTCAERHSVWLQCSLRPPRNVAGAANRERAGSRQLYLNRHPSSLPACECFKFISLDSGNKYQPLLSSQVSCLLWLWSLGSFLSDLLSESPATTPSVTILTRNSRR